MHRVIACLCLIAATASPALAQPADGGPLGTAQAVCKAQRSACIRDNRRRCTRPSRDLRRCQQDVEMQCDKEFEACLGGLPAYDAPAPPPSSPPISPDATRLAAACNALFQRVRELAPIGVIWTTSYHAHGERFTGLTPLELRVRDSTLVAEGTRIRDHRTRPVLGPPGRTLVGPSDAPRYEGVTILIGPDNRILLQGIYGPYQPRCIGGRFAILETGDSIETFNFNVPSP